MPEIVPIDKKTTIKWQNIEAAWTYLYAQDELALALKQRFIYILELSSGSC